jgi:group I intron endonuclease
MKKHGIENFTFEILIICFDNDVVKWEKEYIKKYNSQVPNGYNILSGGQLGDGNVGYRHSDEVKEIIKQKGREFRAKNPNYFELCREKFNKSREHFDFSSRIKNSDKFQKVMQKRRDKIKSGDMKMTEEHKKKVSEGLKRYFENNSKNGIILSDKHRDAVRKALSKPIIQYTKEGVLVKEYSSIAEADHTSGVKKSNIQHVLSGKHKLAGGFIWKYKSLTVAVEPATATDSGPEPADDPVQSQATP